jgi:hypothetical protein
VKRIDTSKSAPPVDAAPATPSPAFEMLPVESSRMRAIGYDANTETMQVQFADGVEYRYGNVKPEQFSAFEQAKSKGSHFHQFFSKNDEHPATPVPKEES